MLEYPQFVQFLNYEDSIMEKCCSLYLIMLCCLLFPSMKGMEEVTIKDDEEINNRRIICNDDCSLALILNHHYGKKPKLLGGEYYCLNNGSLYLYDLQQKEKSIHSIGNHIPLAAKFINDEPTVILYDQEHGKIKMYKLNDFQLLTMYQQDEHVPHNYSLHAMSDNGIKAITVKQKKDGSAKIFIFDENNELKSFFTTEGPYDMSISPDGAYLLLGEENKSELWDISGEKPIKTQTILNHCEFSLNNATNHFFAYNSNALYSCENTTYVEKFDDFHSPNVLTFSKNYYISSKIYNEMTKLYLHQRNEKKETEIVTFNKTCLYNYCIKISEKKDASVAIVIYPIGSSECSKTFYIGALNKNK